MGGLEEPPVADLGRRQVPAHPLAVGDILDGEEHQFVFSLGGKSTGVQQHCLTADPLEIVLHLKIIERAVPRDDLLEECLQCRDVPLPIPQGRR